jgi:hypothetical protein
MSRVIFYPFRWEIIIYCIIQCLIFGSYFAISIMIELLIDEVILHKNSNLAYQYAGILTALVIISAIFVHQGYLLIQ